MTTIPNQLNMKPPKPTHDFGRGDPFEMVKRYITNQNVDKLDNLQVGYDGKYTTIEDKLHQIGLKSTNTMSNYDRLIYLNNDAPILYAYLIMVIEHVKKNVNSLQTAYETRSNTRVHPPPDDNLRNYYNTAKIIFKQVRNNSTERDVISKVIIDAILEFNPSSENEQIIQERQAAKVKNENISNKLISNQQSAITDLKTTIEMKSVKQTMDFDVQNFGGQGDCLFLTLLAYLKVYHPKSVERELNIIADKEHLNKYSGDYENKTDDALLLRKAIVEYVITHETTPLISTNQTPDLTASFQKGQTFGERIQTEYSTGTHSNTTPRSNYSNQMSNISKYGTEVEIAAASQLFNINIHVVNTDGLNLDQPYINDNKSTNICFIFNYNKGHYVILWPVSERRGEVSPRWATSSKEASIAIATNTPQSGLRSSKVPPSKQLHRGVVQVFQGEGEWVYTDEKGYHSFNFPSRHTNAKQNAELIFKPILNVIDYLIDQGYEHIGLTYSANQDQTAEMFEAYEFKHNENSNLSDKVLKKEIKPQN